MPHAQEAKRSRCDAPKRSARIFLALPENERTWQMAALNFYQWLKNNRPELLVRGKGDPYQHLKSDLSGLW
jgi:hypothetical protein